MRLIALTISLILSISKVNASEFKDEKIHSYISDFCSQIITISASDSNKQAKISNAIKLIDDNVNSKWISRFVLGKHYRSFSKEEFDRFKTLYRNYMINAYAPKFLSYKGKICKVLSVSNQKLFYNVKTEFVSVDNPKPFDVSFRVKDKNDNFFIIDFIAEGISLLESQRSELDSVISKLGVLGFLSDLDEKVNKLIAANK